jgi:hypothetical protein
LFSIDLSACRVRSDLDVERLADQPLECRRVSRGGPQLKLGVSSGSKLEQRVLAAIMELEPRYGL